MRGDESGGGHSTDCKSISLSLTHRLCAPIFLIVMMVSVAIVIMMVMVVEMVIMMVMVVIVIVVITASIFLISIWTNGANMQFSNLYK